MTLALTSASTTSRNSSRRSSARLSSRSGRHDAASCLLAARTSSSCFLMPPGFRTKDLDCADNALTTGRLGRSTGQHRIDRPKAARGWTSGLPCAVGMATAAQKGSKHRASSYPATRAPPDPMQHKHCGALTGGSADGGQQVEGGGSASRRFGGSWVVRGWFVVVNAVV